MRTPWICRAVAVLLSVGLSSADGQTVVVGSGQTMTEEDLLAGEFDGQQFELAPGTEIVVRDGGRIGPLYVDFGGATVRVLDGAVFVSHELPDRSGGERLRLIVSDGADLPNLLWFENCDIEFRGGVCRRMQVSRSEVLFTDNAEVSGEFHECAVEVMARALLLEYPDLLLDERGTSLVVDATDHDSFQIWMPGGHFSHGLLLGSLVTSCSPCVYIYPAPTIETSSTMRITIVCGCDRDADGEVDLTDLLDYLEMWFTRDSGAERDLVSSYAADVGIADLLDYLECWLPASAGACE